MSLDNEDMHPDTQDSSPLDEEVNYTTPEEEEQEDYQNFSKEDFVQLLENLSQPDQDWNKVSATLKEVKPIFDEMVKVEKEEALEKFLANGGEEDGFVFKQDELIEKFYQLYKNIRSQKSKQKLQAEQERQKNLEAKNLLLEKLRAITDAEEDQSSLDVIKEIQAEWRKIGPVPSSQNRDLWARYNALVELFYNQRSIHFELKELDRRRNLSKKIELCEKAETLLQQENIQQATKELNELHEEWKHVGPVPKEDKDVIWQRFKTASDALYEKRREYFKQLKEERDKNLEKKFALCQQVEAFATFESDRITEWNAKTKEIIALQKDWEEIRFIPKEKIKEVSRLFWASFKTFFHNKNEFFKQIDQERENNLQQKVLLCEKAEELVNSGKDAKQIADGLKQLQQDWKQIGPAPNKSKQEVYDRFKRCCDEFFNQRRKQYVDEEKSYQENLDKKQAILNRIREYGEQQTADLEQFKTLVETEIEVWNSIGFVPRKEKQKIEQSLQDTLEETVAKISNASEEQKDALLLAFELKSVKANPQAQAKIDKREGVIRRKIKDLEDEISTFRNNIEFFANSKTATNLRESIEQKIEETQKSLRQLKQQLKQMRELQKTDNKKSNKSKRKTDNSQESEEE